MVSDAARLGTHSGSRSELADLHRLTETASPVGDTGTDTGTDAGADTDTDTEAGRL